MYNGGLLFCYSFQTVFTAVWKSLCAQELYFREENKLKGEEKDLETKAVRQLYLSAE